MGLSSSLLVRGIWRKAGAYQIWDAQEGREGSKEDVWLHPSDVSARESAETMQLY